MLKTFALLLAFLPTLAFAQEIEKDLKHFTRVIASPRVNVILQKGTQESIRLTYNNVTPDKINIDVTGKTLRIYLDQAKKVERTNHGRDGQRESMYKDVTINAYVTYRDLEGLEIRGNQELTCMDPIESDAFTLRAYGENEIRFSSLRTGFFKAKLYGENDLHIDKGRTLEQKYLLYGENKIDSKGLRSDYIITSIFGEGSLKINSAEEVRIDAFGEPQIYVDGGANIHRRLVFGKANIFQN
jgi:hypothetical protein